MKIMDDIHDLIYSLFSKKNATEIAQIFGYERKWVYKMQYTNSFVVNDRFIAELDCLGYELVLRKKDV